MNNPIPFSRVPIGAYFEFAIKSQVGCGKYNGLARKTGEDSYRFPCFSGAPSPDILCVVVEDTDYQTRHKQLRGKSEGSSAA